MITQLTPKQEEKIEEYYEKWLAIGLNCEPINKEKVEELVTKLYKYLGKEKPKFIFKDSPLACAKEVKETNINWFCGQTYASWMGYYSYFHDVFNFKTEDEEFYYLIHELIQESHWMIPLEDKCIVSERPLWIKFNEEKQLHADLEPAIKYKDGFSIYALNGVRVPKELVLTPADELDPELVLSQQNAEVRMQGIKKFTIERLLTTLNTEVLDKRNEYELILIEIMDKRKRPYLKMINPSTGEIHVEGVHRDCKTVDQALGFRDPFYSDQDWHKESFVYKKPVVLT